MNIMKKESVRWCDGASVFIVYVLSCERCCEGGKRRKKISNNKTIKHYSCLPSFSLPILFDSTLQMFIRVKWFDSIGSRRAFLPRVLLSRAGSWVMTNASAWHNGMAFFFFKTARKGRGRREKETLWSINNSCSADDLWIAVVNRLLWLLNQLYYTPAREKKMTNDSIVGAISIQVVVASRKKNESFHEWEARRCYDICLECLPFL